MAKSKPADVIEDEIVPAFAESDPAEPAPDLVAEVERLKAELAAKEAELTKAVASNTHTGPVKKFVVSVKDAPAFVVEAAHESMAVPAYLSASGMIQPGHPPVVRAAPDDAKTGLVPPGMSI